MAQGTGYGQFWIKNAVRVRKPHDEIVRDELKLPVIREEQDATVFERTSTGRLRDDETIVYEWMDEANSVNIPSASWDILWDEGDWRGTD